MDQGVVAELPGGETGLIGLDAVARVCADRETVVVILAPHVVIAEFVRHPSPGIQGHRDSDRPSAFHLIGKKGSAKRQVFVTGHRRK